MPMGLGSRAGSYKSERLRSTGAGHGSGGSIHGRAGHGRSRFADRSPIGGSRWAISEGVLGEQCVRVAYIIVQRVAWRGTNVLIE